MVGSLVNEKIFSYKKVKYDADGWASPELFLPLAYDLCFLKTNDKTKMGWYTGNGWDGQKLNKDDVILAWKRKEFE